MITMIEFHKISVKACNTNNDDSYQNLIKDSNELKKN